MCGQRWLLAAPFGAMVQKALVCLPDIPPFGRIAQIVLHIDASSPNERIWTPTDNGTWADYKNSVTGERIRAWKELMLAVGLGDGMRVLSLLELLYEMIPIEWAHWAVDSS